MTKITILGGSGFIGSHIHRYLTAQGVETCVPPRDADLAGRDLGHVIYCIGLTADFRTRPYETVDAHVSRLLLIVRDARIASLTYLSSTRVYRLNTNVASEDDPLAVEPSNAFDIFNISKAMGESIVLSTVPCSRVVRLSNVYGDDFTSDNFLSAVIREAATTGRVLLRTGLDSEKDYVSIDDVTRAVVDVTLRGRHRIYNIASGRNVSNRTIAEGLASATGCPVEVADGAPVVRFPPISIERIAREFNYAPANLVDNLGSLAMRYRDKFGPPRADGGEARSR
jgi:nucleoside-diphosphate-sugar epimerase